MGRVKSATPAMQTEDAPLFLKVLGRCQVNFGAMDMARLATVIPRRARVARHCLQGFNVIECAAVTRLRRDNNPSFRCYGTGGNVVGASRTGPDAACAPISWSLSSRLEVPARPSGSNRDTKYSCTTDRPSAEP